MKLAKWKDRNKVIDIIAATFEDNPGSVWLFRREADPKKAIRCLARFVFIKSYNRKGAYISSNGKGMALCYRFNRKSYSLLELWCKIRFALLYADLKRLKEIRRREEYRENIRPPDGEYLYWWFFGVTKDGGKAGFEIAREIIEVSRNNKLPIYLETAMERNMKVYSRYGYEVYHYWEEPDKDIQFWFMKKDHLAS
jgi:hypothetical protein